MADGNAYASIRAGRRDVLAGLACALGLGLTTQARAATDPALLDISRYVYVPSATTPDVTVVDINSNSISGSLHTGTIAQQAVVSRDAGTLIASDGRSASVSLVDVFADSVRTVSLQAAVQRLTVSANGRLVAASDLAGGTITLIDIGDARISSRITGLPALCDVMFGAQDTVLYIAAEGLGGIGVIDIAKGRHSEDIAILQAGPAGIAALARTADGRHVLAQPQGGGPISVLDPDQGKAVGRLDTGAGAAGMFPSGVGTYLLVPDDVEETLAVFRSARLDNPVVLPGAAGVVGIYTTWLDSIAFMPNTARRSVLVYDLDKMRQVGEIPLHGTPVRGAVTADTRTLYLPVLDPPRLLAIDGATCRVANTYAIASPPLNALIAGGSGICH